MLLAGLQDVSVRRQLEAAGWRICNRSRLPLVCFVPEDMANDRDGEVAGIERAVASSGAAWISTVRLRGERVLRACITSFESTEDDVDELVRQLGIARKTTAR